MTTILQHSSQYFINSSNGTVYMWIEIIYDNTYTIKFSFHQARQYDSLKHEKYIRDISYIPTPMIEMIKLLQLHENDPRGEKMFDSLSTIFNSTLCQTIQKDYETSIINSITVRKDEIEKENESLQHQLDELKKENTKLKEYDNKTKYDEQTHKLTCTHYELLQSTSKINKLEKELITTQATIKQLYEDLEDTSTELKIWESKCMHYVNQIDKLEENNEISIDTILETALDEIIDIKN